MSARLTVSEVDTRSETITLTGTRDNLRRVEAWLHGDVDVAPAGTVPQNMREIAHLEALLAERNSQLTECRAALREAFTDAANSNESQP